MVAILVGAALGLSGALTQTFARNPLASPDILGVTDGAAAGAVAVIVLGGASGYGGAWSTGTLQPIGVTIAAFAGRRSPPSPLYLLAWRQGIDGTGWCWSASASARCSRARLLAAGPGPHPGRPSAQVWLNGSINGRGWEQAMPLLWALVILLPAP